MLLIESRLKSKTKDPQRIHFCEICLLRCVTNPKFGHFLYYSCNTLHNPPPGAPSGSPPPCIPFPDSHHHRLTPSPPLRSTCMTKAWVFQLEVNGKKRHQLQREEWMIQREINVDRRMVMSQWDLCFSRLFSLLLFLSGSKGAKIKPLTASLRFFFRISTQVEEAGGWMVSKDPDVHRQLSHLQTSFRHNNDNEKHR